MKLYTAYTCGNASFVAPFTYKNHQRGSSLATLQQYISRYYFFINYSSLLPSGELLHGSNDELLVTVAPAFSNCDSQYFMRIRKFYRRHKIKRPGFIKPRGRINPSP